MTGRAHQSPWPIRAVPPALRDRYLDNGVWTDDTLGALVDRSLAAAPDATINVWSESRPWHGTYSDVHGEAMRLLGVLRAEGLEAGDVVAFQLPNWREAVVAFYALAMGGYVLVPIVHIYGPKEVRFILAECGARAYISADQYGHVDYLDIIDGAAPEALPRLTLHVVTGAAAARGRVRRIGWDAVDAATPSRSEHRRRPGRRLRARVHVRDDERPQGGDAQSPNAPRRARSHARVGHPGIAHPDGLTGHPRDRACSQPSSRP